MADQHPKAVNIVEAPAETAVCVCGHTAYWHQALQVGGEYIQGAGTCDYQAECSCQRFRISPRDEGLWVVLGRGPGPDSDFVELEDEQGHGVGPASGIGWRQEGELWLLGPFPRPPARQPSA